MWFFLWCRAFLSPRWGFIGFIVFISAGVETTCLFILRPSGTIPQPWKPRRGDRMIRQAVKCNGTPADKQIQFRIKPQRGNRKNAAA